MSRNPKSLFLVFIQGLMLIALFLSGPVIPNNIVSWILEVGGLFLGFWAVWTMRVTNFHITADVAPGSVLVANGPYSFIRHPMYAAVLLVAFGLLINTFTWIRFGAVTILFVDLIIKADYEEILLTRYFKKEYVEYQKKTARFLPFVY